MGLLDQANFDMKPNPWNNIGAMGAGLMAMAGPSLQPIPMSNFPSAMLGYQRATMGNELQRLQMQDMLMKRAMMLYGLQQAESAGNGADASGYPGSPSTGAPQITPPAPSSVLSNPSVGPEEAAAGIVGQTGMPFDPSSLPQISQPSTPIQSNPGANNSTSIGLWQRGNQLVNAGRGISWLNPELGKSYITQGTQMQTLALQYDPNLAAQIAGAKAGAEVGPHIQEAWGKPINVRQGGAVVNPATGQIVAQAPKLAEGQMISQLPGGGIAAAEVPNALTGMAAREDIENLSKARFNPEKVVVGGIPQYKSEAGVLGYGPSGNSAKMLGYDTGTPVAGSREGSVSTQQVPSGSQADYTPGQQKKFELNADAIYGTQSGSFQSEANAAQQSLTMVPMLLDAAKKFRTGAFADVRSDIGNAAKLMGVDLGPDFDPTNAQIIQKSTKSLILASLKSLPGGRVLQAEMNAMGEAFPNKDLTPEALSEIAQVIYGDAKWRSARFDAMDKKFTETGGNIGTAISDFNREHPMPDAISQIHSIFEKNGWTPELIEKALSHAGNNQAFGSDQNAVSVKGRYLQGFYGKVGSKAAMDAAEADYNALRARGQ